MANSTCEKHVDIVSTIITDLTSKDICNKSYTIRGTGDSFEWFAGWTQLRDSLLIHLSTFQSQSQILVPGCRSSSLSQELYDVGFKCITNIDISKVVVMDMLRRHVEERPEMVWLVMDMASMEVCEKKIVTFGATTVKFQTWRPKCIFQKANVKKCWDCLLWN